jgi:hypothetical protein
VLEQDILPRGVPPFFQHLPLLGGLLRRVSLNAIQRLVEDITHLIDEVRVGRRKERGGGGWGEADTHNTCERTGRGQASDCCLVPA